MRTVFQNCTLLDGTEQMSPRPGTDVAIENDRIAQIGKITPNKGDRVVDLTGKYLMPGLINLHVHLPAGGKPQNKPMNTNRLTKIALFSGLSRALVLRMCHGYAMQGLLSGVTTVRAVGGLDNLDTRLRDRIHAGKLDGPRILAANYAIGVPHGHMVGSVTHPAETVEDAVRMVDQLHGQNVDLIKLMITGGVMDAALRSAYFLVTGKNPDPDAFTAVRGMDGWKEATFNIPGAGDVRVAVVSSLGKARKLIEAVKRGDTAYDFVEVMACPGGCAGGGGQPIHDGTEFAEDRGNVLWRLDQGELLRFSHENPDVKALYKDYLGAPLGEKSHHLLHTDHNAWQMPQKML